MVRPPFVLVSLLSCLAVFTLGQAKRAQAHANPQYVKVVIYDHKCAVSPRQVDFGNVHFLIVNRGKKLHRFAFAGHRTPWLKRDQRGLIDLDFLKPGSWRYFCHTPRQATKRPMQGRLQIGTGGQPKWSQGLKLTRVGDFAGAAIVTAPPQDSRRLVVGQLGGQVYLVKDGVRQPRPFADLSHLTKNEGERGLLGLAFAPDYAQSGLLYVYYNDPAGNLHLDELRRSAFDEDVVDLTTRRELIYQPKFSSHHNGGYLQFGPDGYLYLFIGDGGDDPTHPIGGTGQTKDDLFGSILRIDPRLQADGSPYGIPPDNPFVGQADARPEVFAYGLRNPWRGFVDENGDVYVGDVGQGTNEEINLLASGEKGVNFGWPCFEGYDPYDHRLPIDCEVEVKAPIYAYRNDSAHCSVIAGPKMRDSRLPNLDGWLLFVDLCKGDVMRLAYEDGRAAVFPLGVNVPSLISFGVDALGRSYLSSAYGPLYRLDPDDS